jgi:hypothetical protein
MTRQQLLARLRAMPRAAALEELRTAIGGLDLADRFALLHELGVYHHPESMSGAGSTLAETAALRAALPELLRRHGVASLLDLPCGDFHWMAEVPLGDVRYTGADIVPELVARNRLLYGDGERRRFLRLDATRDRLPAADLVLCRDLLIHLSLRDVFQVLAAVVASGARWLLTSHFAARDGNPEIESGDFRPVNLCREPFNLTEPQEVIAEESGMGEGAFRDRSMALWPTAAVGEALVAAAWRDVG